MHQVEHLRNKRRRTDGERVRVTRACDLCKKKKLRCSGTQPCDLCARSNEQCDFTALYTRGRLPPIAATASHGGGDSDIRDVVNFETGDRPMQDVLQPNHLMDQTSEPVSHDYPRTPQDSRSPISSGQDVQMNSTLSSGILVTDASVHRSSRTSPDPVQTDQDGRFIGSSSGVMFLFRALRKIQHLSMVDGHGLSAFDFGDAPLPPVEPYLLILPSRRDALVMIRRHFDFAFPTHRFLHYPTIESWCQRFYDSIEESRPVDPCTRPRVAVILMILAQTKLYISAQDGIESSICNSVAYFNASERYLDVEKGSTRLEGIQARLAQCFWLLTQSRVNHAWTLFGTVADLALASGLHRSKQREANFGMTTIDQECRRRVFWSAYSLDNYLSAALGRPRRFHEEDIDQLLPSSIDDDEITEASAVPIRPNRQSIMAAAVHHAKLSRIIGGILRDLYGIHKIDLDKHIRLVQHYDGRLDEWRNEVGNFLDLPDVKLMVAVCQRQHTVLNLAFSHATILLHRSTLLLQSTRSGAGVRNQLSAHHGQAKSSVEKCLRAARKIVSILRDLTDRGQMFQAFWFTQYYAFSALVVLYVHVIQKSDEATADLEGHFAAAQQGLQDLSAGASENSYVQRYVAVLSELQDEAQKALSRTDGPTNTTQSDPVPEESSAPVPVQTLPAVGRVWDGNTALQPLEASTNDLVASNVGLTGYDPGVQSTDLFAMVGLGELDFLFSANYDGTFEMDGFGLYT